MEQVISIVVEKDGPPVPKRPNNLKPRPRVRYPLDEIPLNGSARIPRAARTVADYLLKFKKTPAGAGKKFVIRAVTPAMCRVWRVK